MRRIVACDGLEGNRDLNVIAYKAFCATSILCFPLRRENMGDGLSRVEAARFNSKVCFVSYVRVHAVPRYWYQ